MRSPRQPPDPGAPAGSAPRRGGGLRLPAAEVPALLALLGALACGATLRLWNLGAQVMSGDEFHAIIAALTRPASQILFVYQVSDNCIPLSLLDRLLLDRGIVLHEWTVRLPVLLSGFALLFGAPLWAWRRLGRGSALALAWLVALSPGLVFYSRIARSYAPATLLGCAAVAAFEAWHRRGGPVLAALYVACGVAAVWFHLGAAPLVLSPFVVAALALALPAAPARPPGPEPPPDPPDAPSPPRRPEPAQPTGPPHRVRAAARLALLGGVTAAALAALLLPAHRTLLPLLGDKHGRLDVSPQEAAEVAAWMAGVASRRVAAAAGVLLGAGFAVLGRRQDLLGAFVLGGAAVQLAGILGLAPFGHQSPTILSRYLVFCLPLLLVPVAAALGTPWPGWWRRAQPWLAAAAVAALLACGPFPDRDLIRSSFAHDEQYLRFTTPRPRLGPGGPAAVYGWLAGAPAGAVVELPWDPMFVFDRVLGLYQALHRRQVVVAAIWPDRRLAFRNMTADPPEALLAAPGRWLIVHRAIVREELHVGGNPWLGTREIRQAFRRRAAGAAARCRARWGPPDYEDEWAYAWDLDRVRRSPAATAAPAGRGGGRDENAAPGGRQPVSAP